MTEDGVAGRQQATGRALVVLRPAGHPAAERPLTDFLTQLIACDRRLPAYRGARRAEPARAAMAYGDHADAAKTSLDRRV